MKFRFGREKFSSMGKMDVRKIAIAHLRFFLSLVFPVDFLTVTNEFSK
jgi:hypothetical protein